MDTISKIEEFLSEGLFASGKPSTNDWTGMSKKVISDVTDLVEKMENEIDDDDKSHIYSNGRQYLPKFKQCLDATAMLEKALLGMAKELEKIRTEYSKLKPNPANK